MTSRNEEASSARSIPPSRAFLVPRRIAALVMLCLFVALHALSVSHSLHAALCADAGQAEHQCAVTTLAHGQVDHAPVDVVVVPPNLCEEVLIAPVQVALADAPFRLLPSRALLLSPDSKTGVCSCEHISELVP